VSPPAAFSMTEHRRRFASDQRARCVHCKTTRTAVASLFCVSGKKHFSFRSQHREEVLNQSHGSGITTRRSLLQNAALSAAAAMAVPAFGSVGKHGGNAGSSPSSFVNLIDRPTSVKVFLEEKSTLQLDRTGDTWRKETCTVDITPIARGLSLSLIAPIASVLRVHVRWRAALPAAKLRVLSDEWERSYGDLGWREVIPERPLPWYFLTSDGERTHGYGVAVGAAALAFWQCDREGVSLWLDVRNGGKGVKLSERALPMATVVVRAGEEGESPLSAGSCLQRRRSQPVPFMAATTGITPTATTRLRGFCAMPRWWQNLRRLEGCAPSRLWIWAGKTKRSSRTWQAWQRIFARKAFGPAYGSVLRNQWGSLVPCCSYPHVGSRPRQMQRRIHRTIPPFLKASTKLLRRSVK
jgi:hypothetical protein